MGITYQKSPNVPLGENFSGGKFKMAAKILKLANDSEKAGVNYFTQPVKIHFCCIYAALL